MEAIALAEELKADALLIDDAMVVRRQSADASLSSVRCAFSRMRRRKD